MKMQAAESIDSGDSIIPASQRPDGTWRKARRVKEGYVPQEEVPLYESKGKKFVNRQNAPVTPVKVDGLISHKSIPGLFIDDQTSNKSTEKKGKKQNKANVEEVTKKVSQIDIKKTASADEQTDPAKRVRNLKKRLKEIETLEMKVKNDGSIKLEPEQLAKIARKNEVMQLIAQIESHNISSI